MIETVLSMIDAQVPPCTPASNAESPAPAAATVDRNNSSSSSGNTASAATAAATDGKSRMLNKRQSTTESAISASEVLCDSLLAGWDPERETAEVGVGGDGRGSSSVIVENGDESGQLAKANVAAKVPMPFSRIATNLEELHKVSICHYITALTLNRFRTSSHYPALTPGASTSLERAILPCKRGCSLASTSRFTR